MFCGTPVEEHWSRFFQPVGPLNYIIEVSGHILINVLACLVSLTPKSLIVFVCYCVMCDCIL